METGDTGIAAGRVGLGWPLSAMLVVVAWWGGAALAAGEAGPPSTAPVSPATHPADPWSKPVNGLQARLFFKRVQVSNGTPIIATHIELRNVSDMGNPMSIPWTKVAMSLRMTDSAGAEVKQYNGPYDGLVPFPKDLVLPYDGLLSFDIAGHGAGIPADMAGMIDLVAMQSWVLPRDGKDYFLQGTLEIPETKRDPNDGPPWDGRLELRPVLVPTRPEPMDAAKVGPLIEELGAKMVANNGMESERATRELSLIDDPRVIPWYVKAIQTSSYELKYAAMDQLCRFNSDEALEGLKKAINTQGADIGNCTTDAVAAQLALNIRHAAAIALHRSPHPKAKQVLLLMQDDPYWPVRQEVLQSLDDSPAALEVLKKLARDPDERMREAAMQYLKAREAATRPAP